MALPPLPDVFGNYALGDFTHVVEPGAVSWWPTAPGWRILAIAALVALAVAAWRCWRRWRRNRYRREAIKALRACQGLPADARLQTMARIIKSAVLVAFPRSEIAALSGERWLDWLDQHGPQAFSSASRHLLAASQYHTGAPPADGDLAILARDCERWLSDHREVAS